MSLCPTPRHRRRLPGTLQPAAVMTPHVHTVTAPWRVTAVLAPASWPPRVYLLRLDASNGYGRYVPLTMRGRSAAGRVVILSATTTWEAYNAWGGYSLYHGLRGFADRARIVSFDRPYDYGDGAADFTGNEAPLVTLAERMKLPVGYATDIDLHTDPNLLDGARAVISLGHDEYYSPAMRAAIDSYLAAGGRPFVVASLDGRGGHHHDTEWVDAVDGTDPVASLALGPQIAAVEGRTHRDRAHRALTGYSMGGYGAVNLAMLHPSMFEQVASIGGYLHVDDPSGMLGTTPAAIAANSSVAFAVTGRSSPRIFPSEVLRRPDG
ncbi:MAG: N,N-dimethylformamidase beta subunit family domain-containing protein [Frankia sp.]